MMFMKKIYLLFILLFILKGSFAQEKYGRYHKNLLYEADIYFENENYYYAADLYKDLHRVDPSRSDIAGKLGICLFNQYGGKTESQPYLEKAVAGKFADAYYYLAQIYLEQYRFVEAAELISKYRQFDNRTFRAATVDHLAESIGRAKNAVESPLDVEIRNLEELNTPYHDYGPVINTATNELYFTSRRPLHADVEADLSGQYDENIYRVNLMAETLQVTPLNLTINSTANDAAVAFTPGGGEFLFFRSTPDFIGGDLLLASRVNEDWAAPKVMSSEVNSRYLEASASYKSGSTESLYFSSNRPGGYGGKDIYVVHRLPNGKWSQPQNAGPIINTPYNEDAPFVSANGILYFSSQGHATIGGYDVFSALPKADGTWEKPQNLGYPINTPGDEIFFTISADGANAWFSSEREGGKGMQDIYNIVFNDVNTVVVKVQLEADSLPVTDAVASVQLINTFDDRIEGLYHSSVIDGSFVMAINPQKRFVLHVQADGYKELVKELRYQISVDEGFSVLTDVITLEKLMAP